MKWLLLNQSCEISRFFGFCKSGFEFFWSDCFWRLFGFVFGDGFLGLAGSLLVCLMEVVGGNQLLMCLMEASGFVGCFLGFCTGLLWFGCCFEGGGQFPYDGDVLKGRVLVRNGCWCFVIWKLVLGVP